MSKGSDGKVKVEKTGLKEITREGYEYELTLNFNLELNHHATASKDRTGLFMDKPEFIITAETGRMIKEWCNSGVVVPTIEEQLRACESIADLGLVYSELSKENKIKYCALKDELKAKLAPNAVVQD